MAEQRGLTGYRRAERHGRHPQPRRDPARRRPVQRRGRGRRQLIPGTLPLPHAFGRLQFGADLDLHFRTLIGTGANPNVAAALVIGIEPNWTSRVADGIATTGKPVAAFSIEGLGDLEGHRDGQPRRRPVVPQDASELTASRWIPLTDLMISTKCGESDTTYRARLQPDHRPLRRALRRGRRHVLLRRDQRADRRRAHRGRARSPTRCAREFQRLFDDYSDHHRAGRRTCSARSRPRATSPAASRRSRRRRSATS